MTVFVPMTGLTLVLQNTPPDSTEVIGFYPSIISDSTAAADQLLSQDSAASFMQTQWRMAAANMLGIGIIAGGWA
ncbi:hypothetical protein [Desulfovibrio legallii]|jgi:hypothetical protein|uniref:Uncharacterized protein n=1 Tax=Desulfovibrio legallii TaxID=571438 RepID=A0A1G7Q3R5_9BACT|nr:hypothetical protein [Desulfovibrio legallii]SDF93134.1 hypothetical protein SAMN05192586_1199 [Desulfovibrio legallii]